MLNYIPPCIVKCKRMIHYYAQIQNFCLKYPNVLH